MVHATLTQPGVRSGTSSMSNSTIPTLGATTRTFPRILSRCPTCSTSSERTGLWIRTSRGVDLAYRQRHPDLPDGRLRRQARHFSRQQLRRVPPQRFDDICFPVFLLDGSVKRCGECFLRRLYLWNAEREREKRPRAVGRVHSRRLRCRRVRDG